MTAPGAFGLRTLRLRCRPVSWCRPVRGAVRFVVPSGSWCRPVRGAVGWCRVVMAVRRRCRPVRMPCASAAGRLRVRTGACGVRLRFLPARWRPVAGAVQSCTFRSASFRHGIFRPRVVRSGSSSAAPPPAAGPGLRSGGRGAGAGGFGGGGRTLGPRASREVGRSMGDHTPTLRCRRPPPSPSPGGAGRLTKPVPRASWRGSGAWRPGAGRLPTSSRPRRETRPRVRPVWPSGLRGGSPRPGGGTVPRGPSRR